MLQEDSTSCAQECQTLGIERKVRGKLIVPSGNKIGFKSGAVLALIYAEGQRPDLATLAALARRHDLTVPFALSHIPADDENWAELLAAGLAFDCRGLAPGAAEPRPGPGALLGLHEPPPGEVVTIGPGPHLAEGCGLLPVVRILAGLGVQLAKGADLRAAYWYPSRCWMAPKYFRGVIEDWLGGGPFPALGLTSLQRESDGTMLSAGLAFFTGQELRFLPDRKLVPAAAAKIAVRLINELVHVGPLRRSAEFAGPEGEVLRVEPAAHGRELKVALG